MVHILVHAANTLLIPRAKEEHSHKPSRPEAMDNLALIDNHFTIIHDLRLV